MPKAKKSDSYDETELKFIYRILINRKQDIKSEIKTIGDRSVLLFGILVAILSALASIVLKDFDFSIAQELGEFNKLLKISGTGIFFTYAVVMFIRIRVLINPNFSTHIYGEYEDIFKQSIENIESIEIEKLKTENKSYNGTLKKLTLYFKDFTLFLILSPFVASIWIAFFWYFVG